MCVERNKMDSELLWVFYSNLLNVSQTALRHCRVRFYTFLGQPLSKQLYAQWSKVHADFESLGTNDYFDTNINFQLRTDQNVSK